MLLKRGDNPDDDEHLLQPLTQPPPITVAFTSTHRTHHASSTSRLAPMPSLFPSSVLLSIIATLLLLSIPSTIAFTVNLESNTDFCLTINPSEGEHLRTLTKAEDKNNRQQQQQGGDAAGDREGDETYANSYPPVLKLTHLGGNYDLVVDDLGSQKARTEGFSAAVIKRLLSSSKSADADAAETSVLWQSTPGDSEGSFFINLQSGSEEVSSYDYQFCVQNGITNPFGMWPDENGLSPDRYKSGGRYQVGQIKVGFNFRGIGEDTMDEEEGGDDERDVEKVTAADSSTTKTDQHGSDLNLLKSSLTELLESFRTLTDHNSYMRSREKSHRDLTEKTNTKVYWWTVVEGVVLGVICFGQVWRLRGFFEKRRKM
jgi:hypothetical protein